VVLGDARARRPGMPDFPDPESSARITERGPEFNGAWTASGWRLFAPESGLSGRRWSVQPRGIEEMLAQSRRPIRTQSWVLRKSPMLTASQMPIAVNATVKAKAARLASMRWRKSSGSSRARSKCDKSSASCALFCGVGRPGGCADVRGRNLSTRCSSSEVMGRWVFNAAGPTFP